MVVVFLKKKINKGNIYLFQKVFNIQYRISIRVLIGVSSDLAKARKLG